MNINLKLIDWKLRQKIILHILIIGIIAVIILTFLYFTTQKNIINILNLQKTELLGAMIECNVTHQMGYAPPMNVGPALIRLANSSYIKSLRILDARGGIINSSNPQEIGTSLDEHTKRKIKEFYSDLSKPDIFKVKTITPTQSLIAIENKEECLRCHLSENKFNGILEVHLDDSATSALFHKNQVQGIIIGLLALGILTFIIIRLFEKIINRPLSELKNEMKKIPEGNLDFLLVPKKKDEIGDLTQSFGTMVKRLRSANQEIEALHKQQIERAGHLASVGELAAGLAHEIKNPIAGIKGALEIIQQKTDEKDPRWEIFDEIIKQTDKIYDIIQDLLAYARPRELEKKPVNPNNCILDAIKLANAQTRNKDIRFNFKGLKKDILIVMDENKIQEVILNLLINSIAAIEDKGEISITVDLKPSSMLEIYVTDDGKGIKEKHLSQIFNPFFTTRRRGTGLGLSICRQIIEAHDGSIKVRSQVGKGTTFTILLPVPPENNSNA